MYRYANSPRIRSAGLAACGIALVAAGIAGSIVFATIIIIGG